MLGSHSNVQYTTVVTLLNMDLVPTQVTHKGYRISTTMAKGIIHENSNVILCSGIHPDISQTYKVDIHSRFFIVDRFFIVM